MTKEVAAILELSQGTVAFHKYNVMEKLGFKNNAELLEYAIQKKMAPDS